MAFSEEFKKARSDAGLSQQALADITKIPKRTIEAWEVGGRTPPEYVQLLVLEKVRSLSKT